MAQHVHRLTASALIGVGAAFDFHAGMKAQAPKWMQRNGLEWLFRLMSEPRRLGRRYLVNNPTFVWKTLQQLSRSSPGRAVRVAPPTAPEPEGDQRRA
jgi:N-acetylglucosaminyldiphosphoundecaprenol N-acetyl-beta-D-mannosaminyltransferase